MAELNHEVAFVKDEPQEIDGADNLWTDKLESYFVSLMVDDIIRGKMQATTFANASWQKISLALKKKTGREYTYLQLKNKYYNLKGRWNDFSNLLKEREISYNSVTGEVIATDDVWRKLLPKHRRAKTFRRKGCEEYDKLCVIFGNPERALNGLYERNKERVVHDSSNGDGDGDVCVAQKCDRPQALEAQATTVIADKSDKKRKLEKISTTASLDSVGISGDQCGRQFGQVEDDIIRCMMGLNSLVGIDGPSYVKATRYIHDDSLWRKMFLCMPDERKKDWVLNI